MGLTHVTQWVLLPAPTTYNIHTTCGPHSCDSMGASTCLYNIHRYNIHTTRGPGSCDSMGTSTCLYNIQHTYNTWASLMWLNGHFYLSPQHTTHTTYIQHLGLGHVTQWALPSVSTTYNIQTTCGPGSCDSMGTSTCLYNIQHTYNTYGHFYLSLNVGLAHVIQWALLSVPTTHNIYVQHVDLAHVAQLALLTASKTYNIHTTYEPGLCDSMANFYLPVQHIQTCVSGTFSSITSSISHYICCYNTYSTYTQQVGLARMAQ